ncbi:lipid II flippase MurJ [Capnocytophaga canimorsus]|uniref:Polysaccharide biosynthesis protein C-terminal domain-containing protein n=1 Tax=Capnocytophaga canimorsus TaxID=28188 RepID=A0A1X7BZ32_9FLAO|nr:lipid II flippase MurJ [Capnocytophaga canimorsus]ATA94028.1 hypothetical protein CGC54_06640 [Capnocytophaga canimorsus]SMD29009.1 conserved membrane hypothetical protein [Capnocytophaga canimorsus]
MQKKSVYFLFLKLLKLPLGVLTLSLTVSYLGVSVEMDSWLVALTGIGTIGLAMWGSINETFRSKFIVIKEVEGEDIALARVHSLLFYIFIFSVLSIVVIWCFPQLLIRFFSTQVFHNRALILSEMFRLLAPFILLNQCVAICTFVLNAYDVFYIPEISSAVSQIVNILLILLFAEQLGIYVLIIALYISTVFLLFFLLYKLRKLKVNIFPLSIPNIEGFKMFFVFSIPFFIPYFFGQLSGVVEKRMATNIGIGAVSILDFSRKIPDIFNGVILSLILTMLLPTLTKFFVNRQQEDFQKIFLEIYQLALFCLISFVTLFFVGGDDLLTLLYGRGKITTNNLQEIIYVSKVYAVSLFGIFSYIVFGMVMLSINKGKVYAFFGALTQVVTILMNVLLVDYFGIIVFPITILIAHMISAFFMFLYFPYGRKKILITSMKYYLYGVVSCFVVYYTFKEYYVFRETIILGNLQLLILKSLFALLVIFLLGKLLRIHEIKNSWLLVQKIIRKYKK